MNTCTNAPINTCSHISIKFITTIFIALLRFCGYRELRRLMELKRRKWVQSKCQEQNKKKRKKNITKLNAKSTEFTLKFNGKPNLSILVTVGCRQWRQCTNFKFNEVQFYFRKLKSTIRRLKYIIRIEHTLVSTPKRKKKFGTKRAILSINQCVFVDRKQIEKLHSINLVWRPNYQARFFVAFVRRVPLSSLSFSFFSGNNGEHFWSRILTQWKAWFRFYFTWIFVLFSLPREFLIHFWHEIATFSRWKTKDWLNSTRKSNKNLLISFKYK